MYRAKDNGRSRYELFDEAMQQWVTTQVALEAALRQAVPAQRAAALLPAVRRGRHRRDPRVRGARALGTSGLRSRRARQLHPARRRDRTDRRHRRLGARRGVPARGGVGSALARAAPRHRGEPLEPPAPHRRHRRHRHGRARAHRPRPDPCSRSSSPRARSSTTRSAARSAPARAPRARRQPRARRLRDRLLVAHLPARVPDQHPQDRQVVRARDRHRAEKTPRSSPRSSRSRRTSASASSPKASRRHEQLAVLHQLGCPYLQGYLFSKPRSAMEIAELVEGPTLGVAPKQIANR